jgi:hypothetical protein
LRLAPSLDTKLLHLPDKPAGRTSRLGSIQPPQSGTVRGVLRVKFLAGRCQGAVRVA